MNIRNLILFICVVVLYVMAFAWVISLGIRLGHSPVEFVMVFAYVIITGLTAMLWPMFEDMYKSIFKKTNDMIHTTIGDNNG